MFGLVNISWPAMQARTDLVCSTTWLVVEYWTNGVYTGSSSTPYSECSFVNSYYSDGGGGQGTTEDPPQGGSGGGGGTTTINNYDTNGNGIVDCYQTAIFHTTSLFITSQCNSARPKSSTGTHDALDLWIAGIDGKPAYSVCTGTVEKVAVETDSNTGAIKEGGWGYYVEIKDADGNIWRYAHLKGTSQDKSGVGLKAGDSVSAGTSKVELCDTSGTQVAHLHLEYWKDGVKTCPTDKLSNCGANKA
jgi:hypothetical protein